MFAKRPRWRGPAPFEKRGKTSEFLISCWITIAVGALRLVVYPHRVGSSNLGPDPLAVAREGEEFRRCPPGLSCAPCGGIRPFSDLTVARFPSTMCVTHQMFDTVLLKRGAWSANSRRRGTARASRRLSGCALSIAWKTSVSCEEMVHHTSSVRSCTSELKTSESAFSIFSNIMENASSPTPFPFGRRPPKSCKSELKTLGMRHLYGLTARRQCMARTHSTVLQGWITIQEQGAVAAGLAGWDGIWIASWIAFGIRCCVWAPHAGTTRIRTVPSFRGGGRNRDSVVAMSPAIQFMRGSWESACRVGWCIAAQRETRFYWASTSQTIYFWEAFRPGLSCTFTRAPAAPGARRLQCGASVFPGVNVDKLNGAIVVVAAASCRPRRCP